MNPVYCFILGVAALATIVAPIWFIGALVDKALFDGWPWKDKDCLRYRLIFFVKPITLGSFAVVMGIAGSTLVSILVMLGCAVAKAIGV